MNTQSKLYYGLPAVWTGNDWLVLSADCENIIHLSDIQIDDRAVFRELQAQNFFAPPIRSKFAVFQLTLITTSMCNLRCEYCFVNAGESALLMTRETAQAAVDTAISRANGKILSVAFFGGEPSLTPGLIIQTVQYAREKVLTAKLPGVKFSITTNGVMKPDFLAFLIENQFLLTVSADGPQEIQDSQRPLSSGAGSSGGVERTLELLARSQCEYKVRTTVTENSVHRLAEIVEWLHGLGGTQIHFEVISIAGRAMEMKGTSAYRRPSMEILAENLKKAIERGSALGVSVLNSSYMNLVSPPSSFCDGNTNHRFAVTPDGVITTCVEVQDKCHPASPQFIVGRFEKGRAVFDNQCRQRACRTQQPPPVNPECITCFARRVCAGGCPVRNFHTVGDSATVDEYRCALIRNMIPYIYRSIDDATIRG